MTLCIAAPPLPRRTWTFNTDRLVAANNCTKASAGAKYDQFFGLDPSNATQMDTQALYQVAAGTDLKHGWVVADGGATLLPFVCRVPSTIFPCYPPPGSPPPPPSPPSPPSPPMTTKCERCKPLGVHGMARADAGDAHCCRCCSK